MSVSQGTSTPSGNPLVFKPPFTELPSSWNTGGTDDIPPRSSIGTTFQLDQSDLCVYGARGAFSYAGNYSIDLWTSGGSLIFSEVISVLTPFEAVALPFQSPVGSLYPPAKLAPHPSPKHLASGVSILGWGLSAFQLQQHLSRLCGRGEVLSTVSEDQQLK